MSGFLYFFPGRGNMPPGWFEQPGLEAVAGLNPGGTVNILGEGPGGFTGILCAPDVPSGAIPALGFTPETQTWTPGPEGKWWIGYDTANRPRPHELARARMVFGHEVILGEARQTWNIPIGLSLVPGRLNLPRRLHVGPDGAEFWEVEKRYRPLCEGAERFFGYFCQSLRGATEGENEVVFDDTDFVDFAVLALSTNYHVGRSEALVLDLIGTSDIWDIGQAVIDWAGFLEMQKKKALDTGGTGSGERG